MFVREADHRIKNSLQAVISLLDRQANRTKVEAARDALPVATARVSSAVAVSGGRLRNAAKLCTNRTHSRCIAPGRARHGHVPAGRAGWQRADGLRNWLHGRRVCSLS